MLHDLHLHTHLSDGVMSPEDVDRLAKANFVKGGITDHVSPYHTIHDEKSFNEYFKALEKFDVFKGCELCLGAPLAISGESLGRLDYIIGSVHALRFERNLCLFFFDRLLRFPDVPYFIQVYTERILHFLNTTKMDILGHPTLLPLFLMDENQDDLFSEEQYSAIVKAGTENGVAFEISSRWKVPTEKFLQECKRQDAVISFGSDAHAPDIAFNFDYPLIMMEKTGIEWDRVFVPEKKG
jgi:histidinol phosphatase-like PHP family hydrolase